MLLARIPKTAPLFLSSFNNGNKRFFRHINRGSLPMEALSVTANIIAVLQAANTIISICCNYSAALKGTSWELTKITKELRGLRDVLELLAALAKRAGDAEPSVETRLPALKLLCEPAAGPLAMCKAELESLKTKLEPPKWTGPVTSKRTALMQTLSWPLKEGETKKMLQNMERYKTTLNMALEMDQTAMSLEIHDMSRVIQAKTSEISEDFAKLKLSFSIAKLDDKLGRWLSAPDPSSNHNEACAKRQATTGNWFIQSNNFAKWKEDRNSLLWLHGIPGCGKTILCSTVIEDVLLSSPAVETAIAYFYFDFRKTEDQHEGMMRSFISQLAAQCTNQPNPLESLYSSCGDGDRQPKLCELKQTLQDLIKSFDDTFIIVDALDECKEREQLLGDIRNFVEWQFGGLHILVTSRRETDIKETLDHLLSEDQNIDIQSEVVDRDIRVYVREILQTAKGLSRWRNKPEVQDEIEKVLTENAHGMFRWVVCQIDELKKCLNLPMLRKQLKSLPATLPQTYERILLNIDESYSRYVLKLLQWLTYSKSPLSLSQLVEIVAIDENEDPRFDPERRFPEPEDILLMCSSLVTATEEDYAFWEDDAWEHYAWEDPFEDNALEDNASEVDPRQRRARIVKVELAHFSVKEYLVSSQIMHGKARKYSIQENDAHVGISRDCLSYILYFKDDIRKRANCDYYEFPSKFPLAKFPLTRYATREWPEHTRVGGQINEESMVDLIMELFTSEGTAYASRLIGTFCQLLESNTPLYFASKEGLLGVARRLIAMGIDIDTWSGSYGSALCSASAEGHTEMVKLLLETGADPNALERQGSAVYWASGRGYDAIVRLLLDAGAVVEFEENRPNFSALHTAAGSGHANIVSMLISNGISPNLGAGKPLNFKKTALGHASWQGHDKVVKVLVEAGVDPDSKNAALHIASRWGFDEQVKLLLRAGANVNQGWDMASPLREAMVNGNPTTMKILLDAGADVNLGGSWNRDNLEYWPLEVRQEMQKLLVAAGAKLIGGVFCIPTSWKQYWM